MRQPAFLIGRVPTPIGAMLVVSDVLQRLCALDWEDHAARMQHLLHCQYRNSGIQLVSATVPAGLREPLQQYLAGKLDAIDSISVATAGTPFQNAVWQALRHIPAGMTLTYAMLAARIGRPTAVRAVGAANGANPISVVIPCHRLIGANGSLVAYGGGLHRKRWLLTHEGALQAAGH